MTEKSKLLIRQLKQVRIEKKLSYRFIVSECERIGYSVSLSTVSRVFSDDSEEQEFRFATLRPIARVVLELDEDQHSAPPSSNEADALRTLIDIRDRQIADLQCQLDDKAAEIVRLNKIIDRLLDR